MMDFQEIARQSKIAARKKEVIDNLKKGVDRSICFSYGVCPEHFENFTINEHEQLFKDIAELIITRLEKENAQTETNLKNWVR